MSITKNIYQVWLQGNISEHIKNNLIHLNPDYKYNFFNNQDCLNFLKEHTNEKIVQSFCNIKNLAHKSDLFRYCILKKFGGVYIDVDLELKISLDKIIELSNNSNFITAVGAHTNNSFGECTNGFIMCTSNNNIFDRLIETIINNNNPKDYGLFVKDIYNKLNNPLPFIKYNHNNITCFLFKEIKFKNKYYIIDSLNNIIINTNGHVYLNTNS